MKAKKEVGEERRREEKRGEEEGGYELIGR